MQIFTTVSDIKNHLKTQKNKTIGFIPTMGALHEGHLSLIREAKKNCDITVVSIFVNPTQFAPNEDFDKYPRPIEQDKVLLKKENIDVLFLPSVEEIYPKNENQDTSITSTKNRNCHSEPVEKFLDKDVAFRQTQSNTIVFPAFTKILEGSTRPTHFQGVAQVVKRLFEIIQPTDAFFGQKDFQQTLVIKWLIKTFQYKINLRVCPIVREKPGLALSSRNQYLNAKAKKTALVLKQTLDLVKELIQKRERNVSKIEIAMQKNILKEKKAEIDYAVIRDKNNLSEMEIINQNAVALIAVKIGKTRLIDNAFL